MTRTQMAIGLRRLYAGFGRHDSDLTPERLDAIFGRIGHYSSSSWEEAVTGLLCHTRFPEFEAMLKSVDDAAEIERKREVIQTDDDAKRFLGGNWEPLGSRHRHDPDYGRFRMQVLLAVVDGGSVNDVAAMLESQAAKFDGYDLAGEASRLRSMGNWNPTQEHPTYWERTRDAKAKEETRLTLDLHKQYFRSVGPPPDETYFERKP